MLHCVGKFILQTALILFLRKVYMSKSTTNKHACTFIAVTGGVCSSIGKGVLTSSIGTLLQSAGYNVQVMKWDPYLNIDPGTMSPLVHGEVFVTHDGAETDLDLGHYERILGMHLTAQSSASSGQLFHTLLQRERQGYYLGRCIQLVPHAVDLIKERIVEFAEKTKADFLLIETGGTVGDLEGEIFLEGIRQLAVDRGKESVILCHLSYVPYLSWAHEIKTKPTQHSVALLKKAGLIPDLLCLRVDAPYITDEVKKKLSVMCGVDTQAIFSVPTHDILYKLFLDLDAQGVSRVIQEKAKKDEILKADLSSWQEVISVIQTAATKKVSVGMIVKYVGASEPYISVVEAIKSAAYASGVTAEIHLIDAYLLEEGDQEAWSMLHKMDGIVVPGGFGVRGTEGKIAAAGYARKQNVPYLGLCLGLHIMLVEAARSLLNLPRASSTEFDPNTPDPVIILLEEQKDNENNKGGSMRLGAFPCTLSKGSEVQKAYDKEEVLERHRHRWEVNNLYKESFEKSGVVFSGIYKPKQLVEIAEFSFHPFMVGVQFHPEFLSTPRTPHPLFKAFMKAAIEKKGL